MARFILGHRLRALGERHGAVEAVLYRLDRAFFGTLLWLIRRLPVDTASRLGALAAQVDHAFVGIGTFGVRSSVTIVEDMLLTEAELGTFLAQKPAGDISGRFFDDNGIELAWDREPERWLHNGQMVTGRQALDFASLLGELDDPGTDSLLPTLANYT